MEIKYLKLRVLRLFLTIIVATLIIAPGYFIPTNYFLIFVLAVFAIHIILYIMVENYFSPFIIICPSLKELPEYKHMLKKKKKGTAVMSTILMLILTLRSLEADWEVGPYLSFNAINLIFIFIAIVIFHMIHIYSTKDHLTKDQSANES